MTPNVPSILSARLGFALGPISLALSATLTAAVVARQIPHCDPHLPVSTDNPFGYRLRGDRCEGVYVQPVASTPLVVASLGQLSLPERFPTDSPLLVRWAATPGEVRLRAGSLKSRTYYRMDSRQGAGTSSYRWPTDVLSAMKLGRHDLGLIAWTQQKVGDRTRDVYLPVRIGELTAQQKNSYELVLLPGTELTEVFVGVWVVTGSGQLRAVTAAKPLNYRFYPAGRSIPIPLGPLPASGVYFVEIGATLPGGGAISHEVWFVHVNG